MREEGKPEKMLGTGIYPIAFTWPFQLWAACVAFGMLFPMMGLITGVFWLVSKPAKWLSNRSRRHSAHLRRLAVRRKEALAEADKLIERIGREVEEEWHQRELSGREGQLPRGNRSPEGN
jgi:hypothetical protein